MRSVEVIRGPEWALAALTAPQTHQTQAVPERALLCESRSPRDAATSTLHLLVSPPSPALPSPLAEGQGNICKGASSQSQPLECVTTILSKHPHPSEAACWQKHRRGQEHCVTRSLKEESQKHQLYCKFEGFFSSGIGCSYVTASLFCSVPALSHCKEQKHFSPEP